MCVYVCCVSPLPPPAAVGMLCFALLCFAMLCYARDRTCPVNLACACDVRVTYITPKKGSVDIVKPCTCTMHRHAPAPAPTTTPTPIHTPLSANYIRCPGHTVPYRENESLQIHFLPTHTRTYTPSKRERERERECGGSGHSMSGFGWNSLLNLT